MPALPVCRPKAMGGGVCHASVLLQVLLPWQIQVPWKERLTPALANSWSPVRTPTPFGHQGSARLCCGRKATGLFSPPFSASGYIKRSSKDEVLIDLIAWLITMLIPDTCKKPVTLMEWGMPGQRSYSMTASLMETRD